MTGHSPMLRPPSNRYSRIPSIVLWVLSETQKELGGRNVPTAMLYGRVLEHIDMSEADLYDLLIKLGAASKDVPGPGKPR